MGDAGVALPVPTFEAVQPVAEIAFRGSRPAADFAASAGSTAASVPQPRDDLSLDDRVRVAVANAADGTLLSQPSPPSAVLEAAEAAPSAPIPALAPAFAVVVRLVSGERLAVDAAESLESAAQLARSLAGRFSQAGDWPLVGGRFIRPEAVVSIDIERGLEG